MKTRLNLNDMFPEAYRHLKEIDAQIKAQGLNPLYLEMIKTRASQLNGCAYCLNKHVQDAIKLGEDPKRMYVLSAWMETPDWFTDEEQIILRLTEEITQIGSHGISDEVYDQAITLFGEQKTAFLVMAAININSWNRIGVGLALHPVR
ncbi:alkylhydroperoxidase AhpD family core domain-containing protein [Mucilaginibacter pineti]|uniref:Alkylhydroperoxidase AhpD family core domain-containing protein n=1 Tax=Mucilaginibacter pineti TaxID=1391627 RepID=A0A1G7JN51_9SPHI|nr:carboxymuconolactone decarboxylase family protein [Mucilaginibacter pineti]SDF26296.1 alkylhydroperoxidase AhpD family core domain-containing protein [Mucilaginibacter pineti]